jgi:drug/metabolite transporter (DMT)-like permease
MMFYFYTILIPVLIIITGFYLEGKPNKKRYVVNFLFKIFITFFIYTFLLYYLEMENIINSGWSFYTMLFFLIPFGILIIPFKCYFFLNKEK